MIITIFPIVEQYVTVLSFFVVILNALRAEPTGCPINKTGHELYHTLKVHHTFTSLGIRGI